MMSVGAAENDDDDEAHEYDIVVCHGNVIRCAGVWTRDWRKNGC